jgi:alanyl-tRNA synthetase
VERIEVGGMTSSEIRQRFLDFFAGRGHTVVPSASLVPDDPTLLFTNAGMVQFKDTFLGLERRSYTRAVSAQKCLRVSGKHNDLETVGPSPWHHTFFEMLGNFSFGDYFKRDAIHFAWAFVTDELGVPAERLVATVFRSDETAMDVWIDEIGLPAERVLAMGEKTNFWMMADVGPCGPTSEIHYDFGPERCTCGRDDCSVALDNGCGRWLEIWNNVFMQFDQTADGRRLPLPQPGVDTGMSLERITTVCQHVYATYETDLFTPILTRLQALAGHGPAEREATEVAYRVVADHSRAMAFLIAEGVVPGNEGRGYVLRLIMRRAMRFGRRLGFHGPFLGQVVEAVVDTMAGAYPELGARSAWVRQVVDEEEARFARTIESGTSLLDEVVARVKAAGGEQVPGEDVFRLYDTYGFPPDLTRVIAEEEGLGIDLAGYEVAMAAQRERARRGAAFGAGAGEADYRRLGLPATEFLGYEHLDAEATVLALLVEGQPVQAAEAGMAVEVVLDRSPFYAESGGQVGDTGRLETDSSRVDVDDTRSPIAGLRVHQGRVVAGRIGVGERVRASVDPERRLDIMRNHTATHLLHRALQEIVGAHAQQRGSLVAPDRLRFDFAHLKPLSGDERVALEAQVNRWVRDDRPVAWETVPMATAREAGAMMLFGEKYGDVVRMVTVDGVSRELCGGTHLERTGQIGSLVITDEGSVGAGLRRLEAVTGRGAEQYVRERLDRLAALASALGVTEAAGLDERARELLARQRELGREVERLRSELARVQAAEAKAVPVTVDGVAVLARRVEVPHVGALREQADVLREALGSGIIVVGGVLDGAPRVVAAVTPDLVGRGLHAGQLVKQLAGRLGGGGGGRPNLAEAGGRDPAALDAALAAVPDLVAEQLAALTAQS